MILKIVLILFTTMSSYAQEVNYTPVPKGNRSASMPKIPDSSIDRLKRFVTWQTREDQIEGRFQAIMKELDNPRTKRWIISAAMLYDIDPTLIVGCIVGEHTFNVDWKDYYQNLAAEMTLGWVNKLAQSTYKLIM